MPTAIIILVLYTLFSGLIYIILRNKKGSLSLQQIALFFGCKIGAGCLYGYVYGKFYHGDDTWGLNHDAWLQYQRLVHTPGLFFGDLFTRLPDNPDLYFSYQTTYPERLEYALTTKIMAPFNCISQGNYYINIVFFSFLTFWGAWFLYKLLVQQFALVRTHSLRFVLFLFLPVVFWLSGYRGEGFLLLFTGILLYYFAQVLKKPGIGNSIICITAFLLAFIIRNSFALSLLPCMAAWWLSTRSPSGPIVLSASRAYGVVYATLILLVIAAVFLLPPAYNPLQSAVQRQHSFLDLHGNTRFNLTPLQNNIGSFVAVAPEALTNTLLRPWPWEAKGALQWLVALENIFVWAAIIGCIARFSDRIKIVFRHPFSWLLLCAALSNYLFIGYIVPFPGAIVRYRAMPELFLLCLIAVVMNRPATTR